MHKEHGISAHYNTLGSHRNDSCRRSHEAAQMHGNVSMVYKLLPDVEGVIQVTPERGYCDIDMAVTVVAKHATHIAFAVAPCAYKVVDSELVLHKTLILCEITDTPTPNKIRYYSTLSNPKVLLYSTVRVSADDSVGAPGITELTRVFGYGWVSAPRSHRLPSTHINI